MESQFLTTRNVPENVFSVSNLKEGFNGFEKDLLKINSEWKNVQKLNHLFHYTFEKIQEENNDIFDAVFSGLEVIVKDFYVHFSIIYKLIEKINENSENRKIKEFFIRFKKKFEYKIQISRNQVIIHKEKVNFRDLLTSSFDGLRLEISTTNGNFELDPLRDAKIIENHLFEFKNIIE